MLIIWDFDGVICDSVIWSAKYSDTIFLQKG